MPEVIHDFRGSRLFCEQLYVMVKACLRCLFCIEALQNCTFQIFFLHKSYALAEDGCGLSPIVAITMWHLMYIGATHNFYH